MTELVLVPARSKVKIHTFAEGLLARFAHDLELHVGALTGSASSDDNGASGMASIEAPLRGLSVAGVVGRDGRVDASTMSASDCRDCLAKMQSDVFHARPEDVVRLEVHLDGGSARVRLVPPNGRAVESVIPADTSAEGDALRAKGTFEISLAAIGSDVVKGPMNAFRVKDKVKVTFDVVFALQPA